MRSKALTMLLSSVVFDFRNFLLAGTLKKRFSILKLLPTGHEHGSCDTKREPAMVSSVPTSSSAMRVLNSTCDTAAMEASASPRNPIVCRLKRSSAFRIFDVA